MGDRYNNYSKYLSRRKKSLDNCCVPGPQGTRGPQGFQGIIGPTGPQGPVGLKGARGFQGSQGHSGFQGDTGAQGFQGDTGAQGFQGDTGAQGFQGDTGAQGFQGHSGFQGDTGAQGFQGHSGFQGDTGAQGFQGHSGFQGDTGPSGGPVGPTGAQGLPSSRNTTCTIMGSPGPNVPNIGYFPLTNSGMTIKQSFHPICKNSYLKQACFSFGLDNSDQSSVGTYSIYYTKGCTESPWDISPSGATGPDGPTGVSLCGTNRLIKIEHPIDGNTGYYKMIDVTSQIDTTTLIPAGSFIYANYVHGVTGSVDVRDTMLSLCFQTDNFFFLNRYVIATGCQSNSLNQDNPGPGQSPDDNISIPIQNFPEPSLFPMYNSETNPGKPWTISFWFCPVNITNKDILFSFGETANGSPTNNCITILLNQAEPTQSGTPGNTTLSLSYGSEDQSSNNQTDVVCSTDVNFNFPKGKNEGGWFLLFASFKGGWIEQGHVNDFSFNVIDLSGTSPVWLSCQKQGFPGSDPTTYNFQTATTGNILDLEKKYNPSSNNEFSLCMGEGTVGSAAGKTMPHFQSDIAIWDKELTSSERVGVLNGGTPGNLFDLPEVPRPMHWWSFQKNLNNNVSSMPDFSFSQWIPNNYNLNRFVDTSEFNEAPYVKIPGSGKGGSIPGRSNYPKPVGLGSWKLF
jgi:hypothetical protein